MQCFVLAAESNLLLKKEGTYSCGKQPKQVVFSPDSKYIVLPLLDENGFDIFSVSEKKVIKRIVPLNNKNTGFAEGIFLEKKKSFLVSQMTTGLLYEYSYPEFEFKRVIKTKGVWSKFIAYNEKYNLLFVSNWISNNVSVIDYDSGEIKAFIKTKAAPRGMDFADDGESLIVLCFDGSTIQKFSIKNFELSDSIYIEKSAMRHIAVNSKQDKAWVSDMYHAVVYELNLSDFKIGKKYWVFNNPNTIDLLNDQYLFVSCRGPNNKEDYTKRSPVNGKVFVFDVLNQKKVCELEGGNQPTGLDISPDKKLLVFSNFQDAAIEIYDIQDEK